MQQPSCQTAGRRGKSRIVHPIQRVNVELALHVRDPSAHHAGSETKRDAPKCTAFLGRLQPTVYFLLSSFHGSFTAVPTVSISTLASLPPTLRTSRRYSFCTKCARSVASSPTSRSKR